MERGGTAGPKVGWCEAGGKWGVREADADAAAGRLERGGAVGLGTERCGGEVSFGWLVFGATRGVLVTEWRGVGVAGWIVRGRDVGLGVARRAGFGKWGLTETNVDAATGVRG
jgi:hypothetical protein